MYFIKKILFVYIVELFVKETCSVVSLLMNFWRPILVAKVRRSVVKLFVKTILFSDAQLIFSKSAKPVYRL